MTMKYRLEELAKLAAELSLPARRVDEDRLDVTLPSDCILAFCNLPAEEETLVGFDGTPWHSHGIVQFLTGDATYIACDELGILIGLGAGELLVVSRFVNGDLQDRWLAHRKEKLDLQDLEPSDELRIFRLGSGAAPAKSVAG